MERKRKFNKDKLQKDEMKAMHKKQMELNNLGKSLNPFRKIQK